MLPLKAEINGVAQPALFLRPNHFSIQQPPQLYPTQSLSQQQMQQTNHFSTSFPPPTFIQMPLFAHSPMPSQYPSTSLTYAQPLSRMPQEYQNYQQPQQQPQAQQLPPQLQLQPQPQQQQQNLHKSKQLKQSPILVVHTSAQSSSSSLSSSPFPTPAESLPKKVAGSSAVSIAYPHAFLSNLQARTSLFTRSQDNSNNNNTSVLCTSTSSVPISLATNAQSTIFLPVKPPSLDVLQQGVLTDKSVQLVGGLTTGKIAAPGTPDANRISKTKKKRKTTVALDLNTENNQNFQNTLFVPQKPLRASTAVAAAPSHSDSTTSQQSCAIESNDNEARRSSLAATAKSQLNASTASFIEPVIQLIPDTPRPIKTKKKHCPALVPSSNSDADDDQMNFPCPLDTCKSILANKYSLKRHLKQHAGLLPFQCPICAKKFIEKSALTRHSRVHTGEKPYACHIKDCPRSFAESSNLRRHLRMHSRCPYFCKYDGCIRMFSSDAKLAAHLKLHNSS